MLKTILERLKSPVVIVQLIVIAGTVVTLLTGVDQAVKEIVGAIAVIVNVIAGLNNPADKQNF
jgi:hypothetical protein